MSIYNNKYDILASTIKPNPASVKYWADLQSNPNGGDLKYFDGKDWVYVNNKATGDIAELQEEIANKVDKVEGKGLSTEDFTTEEKTKLAGLSNYNDDDITSLITALTLRVETLETDYTALEARVAALETPAA